MSRHVKIRRSDRSLEWDSLPVIGAGAVHAARLRSIRRFALFQVVFWAGVVFALVVTR